MRIAPLVIGVGVATLILSGCSKSDNAGEKTTVEKSTVTETVTATSGSSTAPTPAATGTLPQPPSGATQLKSSDSDGVQHARYSLTGQTPKQVVDYYVGLWKGEGYTIESSSSGGDAGQYGGSGANATGNKAGTYVGVDAGGSNGEATYFDVCVGSDKDAAAHCGKHHD